MKESGGNSIMKITNYLGRYATVALLGGALIVSATPAQAQNRQWNEDRREDRQDAREERREDRQDAREERREDRQEAREDRREYRAWRASRADITRIAQANGYTEGFEAGLEDKARRERMNYRNEREYTRATQGYRGDWGSQSVYQSVFRQAFARGYQDAYYGRARNRTYDRGSLSRYYGQYGYDPYYRSPAYRTAPAVVATTQLGQTAANRGFEDGYLRGQYDRNIGVRRPNPQGHGAYEHALNGWVEDWGGAAAYQQIYRQYFMQGYEQGYAGRRTGFTYRP
jgi:hypothetical protein